MSTLQSRPFFQSDLDELLHLVTNNTNDRWPKPSYLLGSDVAWQLSGSSKNIHLWFDDQGLAAYAWFNLSIPSNLDLRTDIAYDTPIASEVLAWLEDKRRTFKPRVPWLLQLKSMEEWEQAIANAVPATEGKQMIVQVSAFDYQTERIKFLETNGYTATEHFNYFLVRSLDDPIPDPTLLDGWRIRHVDKSDFEARTAVHRASWFRSTYDLEQYTKVRAISIFDPELDLVVESPTGEFASYCIGWVDKALGIGSFEPVGTAAKWRRQGFGRQVQYEGLRRMKAKGMHSARVNTAGFNDRAYGLYTSCGFKRMDLCRTYMKVL